MSGNGTDCHVAIIGAGPYGLAAAAHLKASRVDTRVFGEPMESWERHMPRGMLLRSSPGCSQIADPNRELTLERFREIYNVPFAKPLPIEDFVRYGQWFQQRAVPDLDRRRVALVSHGPRGFRLGLEDGEELTAHRVVVAAGICSFAYRPPQFGGLPATLVSHACDHADLKVFAGKSVVVLGAGQSALESAALLREAGADVEVIARRDSIFWLGSGSGSAARSLLRPLLRPIARPNFDIMGPRIVSWLLAAPRLYRRAPGLLRRKLMSDATRPAGAGWLVPRLRDVRLTVGHTIRAAAPVRCVLRLELDDGSERLVDHLLLATGYRVDVRRYPFLSEDLRGRLEVRDGYPVLRPGLESSVPGLHFAGTAASASFGPLCRFVVGSGYAARALTFHIYDRSN